MEGRIPTLCFLVLAVLLLLLPASPTLAADQHECELKGPSVCVAKATADDKRVQAALDYVCGHGADCSAIQPGAACFKPDTRLAHASYAFNDYYQRHGRTPYACDFAGAAVVIEQDDCGRLKGPSVCVAKAHVGEARLQAALDYACGHGADCSAIQPGAPCFAPNTRLAHATYAFNDYYERQGRNPSACDFAGVGTVIPRVPKAAGKCKAIQFESRICTPLLCTTECLNKINPDYKTIKYAYCANKNGHRFCHCQVCPVD